MQKIIIYQGLPASGKTSYAIEFIKNNPEFKRVNKDDIRSMLCLQNYRKENEKMVEEIRDSIILKAIAEGYSMIVDDTNFNDKHYHHIYALVRDLIEAKKLVIEVKFFEVTLEEALKRNSLRANKVPDNVIIQMYEKYIENKTKQEIADRINKDTFVTKYVYQEPKLPKAIIVDIDGTIAIRKDRHPFEWDKVYSDDINQPVVDIVIKYANTHKIIFLSGREEVCREETERWIRKKIYSFENVYRVFDDYRGDTNMGSVTHKLYQNMIINTSNLQMRPIGDKTSDVEVKRKLFDEIRKKYYIDFILDDRDCVVKFYRDEGFLCLQVQSGNF